MAIMGAANERTFELYALARTSIILRFVLRAALKSRGVEPFIREYLKQFFSFLLNEEFDKIHALTDEYKRNIEEQTIPLNKLAKSETLKDSPESYKTKISSGKGRRSAAYELAVKAERNYRQGDQISYYVIGGKKKLSVVDNSCLLIDAPKERDENTLYYVAKLDDIYKKFAAFIPDAPIGEFKLE